MLRLQRKIYRNSFDILQIRLIARDAMYCTCLSFNLTFPRPVHLLGTLLATKFELLCLKIDWELSLPSRFLHQCN